MEEVVEPRKKNTVYPEGFRKHYKETKYFLNYYHSHKHSIECPNCHKQTDNAHIREHQKSKKCLNFNVEKCKEIENPIVDLSLFNLADEKDLKLLLRKVNQIKYKIKKDNIIHQNQ